MSNKNNNVCAACPNTLKNIGFLRCFRCKEQYHYSCMNFSAEDYKSFTSGFKASWICLACRCKEPKTGSNCNTPIRPAPQAQTLTSNSTGSQYDNVTLRAKQKSSVSATTSCGHSCSCLTVAVSEL